jgi:hypothetical protein
MRSMLAMLCVTMNKSYTFRHAGDGDRSFRRRQSRMEHDRHNSISLRPGRRGGLGQQRPAGDVKTDHQRTHLERPSQRYRAGLQCAAEQSPTRLDHSRNVLRGQAGGRRRSAPARSGDGRRDQIELVLRQSCNAVSIIHRRGDAREAVQAPLAASPAVCWEAAT